MSINEKATTTVEINGEQARQELDLLKREAVAWRNKMVEASEAGDTKGFKKAESELRKVNAQMRTMQKSAFDINNVLNNLSTSGPKDLQRALKAINAELNSGRVQRGSEEWKKYNVQAKQVSAELRKINAEQRESVGWFSRFNNGLSKWGGTITSIIAGLTGVTLALSKMRSDRNDKEESADNLKALTGLDDESIGWLTKQAEVLSTTMDKSGLRVKQSSRDILEAYMLVGSAKPELLTSKEALNSVTIEAMRLSAAAKMDLKSAVDAVTISMNQYSAGADQASKYTNILAAGSKFGSANVQSQAAAIVKAGVAASGANVSIEQLVGSIEMLGEKGIKDEVAGTGLKTFFLRLQTGVKETNPAIVGFDKTLDNLKKKQMSPAAIKKMFGDEGYSVAKILIDNVQKVKEYTKAVTGTNVAVEQAAINSDNAAAKSAQMKNKLKEVGIELMERLNPSLNVLGTYFTNLIKIIPPLIGFIQKYGVTIVYLSIVLGTYLVVQKLVALWTTNFKNATLLSIAAQKLKALADKAVTASTLLYSAATYALKGNTDMAKQATVAFFKVLKLNPYAAILTVIVAIVGAFYLLTRRTDAQTKAMQSLEKIRLTSIANTSAEKTQVESLLKISRDEALSKAERLRAISKLNQISPEYLGNLTLETINTEKAKKAVDSYIESIQRKARVQATESRLIEVESQILELEKEDKDRAKGDSFWGTAKNVGWMLTGGLMDNNAEKIKKDIYALKTESLSLAKLIEDINKEDIRLDPSSSIRSLEIVNKELEEAQKRLTELKGMTTSQRSKLDYKKELADAKEKIALLKVEKDKLDSGDSDWDGENQDENKAKKALKAKIEKYEEETMVYKASITAMYTAGRITRKEHDDFIEDADRKLLSNKMTLYSKKSSEYHDLLIKLLNMEIKAQEVCAKETIAEIEEGIDKEKRLLFDKYTDQTLSKKAYDEGILRLDRDALVRKQAQYASNSDEFRDYQRRIEEFDAKDKEKRYSEYENRLAEFRKEYQKKTLWELHKEELDRLDELLKVKAIKIEEYEKFKAAITKKYSGSSENSSSADFGNDSSQNTGEKSSRKIKSYKEQKADDIKELEGNTLSELDKLNELYINGDILYEGYEKGLLDIDRKYKESKDQVDEEYKEKRLKRAQILYSGLSSIASAYSEFVAASQELEIAKVNQKYDSEIKAAGNNTNKAKQLEEKKEKDIAAIKTKYANRAFAIQLAMAIASTATAAINAYASAAGIPFIGGLTLAPIAAGMAVAAGMLQVATITKQHQAAQKGYYTGGFTPSGRWDEEQGSVHSDEFIANRFAVRNKEIRPVLNLIDRAQKNNTIGSLKASDVSRAIQRNSSPEKESGLSSGFSTGQESQDVQYLMAIVSQTASINKKLLERLNEPFVTVNSVDGPHGMQQAFDNYNGIQRNKSRHD